MLLEEIIGEASSLRLAGNRAMVQANAADLLWARDEGRARALFGEAVVNVCEVTSGVPDDDAEYESLSQEREDLRRSVLEIIARRDVRLARTLLRATIQPPQESDFELRLELSLAAQAAAKDPRQAAHLAEETLERGIAGRLPELIAEVGAKDREAAARLASAVVAKLRSTQLGANEEAAGVALGLFRLGAEAVPGAGGARSPTPLLDRQSMQTLTETIITIALNAAASDADLLPELQPLLAVMEKYAPARVPLVRRKIAQQAKATGRQASSSPEPVPHGAADEDRPQAAAKAWTEDEARKMLATRQAPAERVTALLQLAKLLREKNEGKRAAELLEEARGLVNHRARNFTELGAQLRVAYAFAPVDPARSLAIIEPVIDQLNEVANAAVIVNSFITEEQLARHDELVLRLLSDSTGALAEEAAEDFVLLTHTRFDEMKQLANRFQRHELRIMARLLLARSVLTQQPAIDS